MATAMMNSKEIRLLVESCISDAYDSIESQIAIGLDLESLPDMTNEERQAIGIAQTAVMRATEKYVFRALADIADNNIACLQDTASEIDTQIKYYEELRGEMLAEMKKEA